MRYTNLINLSEIEFNDADQTRWLQVMPLGTYHHPDHGPLDFTVETLSEYASGVNERIRTAELDIDYDHKKYHGEASGWIKQAEVRADGLWALVEWTTEALQKIKAKKYKYFSPEFVDRWTHPKTGKTYKNVLLGGAITNRPFLRDIATLNLTESQSEELMFEQLREELGLPDDADEGTVLAAVKDAKAAAAAASNEASQAPQPIADTRATAATTTTNAASNPEGGVNVPPVTTSVAASETNPSDDPVVKHMGERIDQLELALRLSETDKLVNKLNQPGRKFAIAPVMLEEVKTLMLDSGSTQLSEKVYNLFDKITRDGLVELGERGTQTNQAAQTATKQFSDLVDGKRAANDKLSYADACEIVAAENPAMWDSYRDEITLGGGQ